MELAGVASPIKSGFAQSNLNRLEKYYKHVHYIHYNVSSLFATNPGCKYNTFP